MEAGALNVTEHDPSNPREIFRLLWRRRKILLFCVVMIPIVVYLYSENLTKSYESSTILQIQSIGDASQVITDSAVSGAGNIEAVARLASTSGVADETARNLGYPEGSLRGSITATADEGTGFMTLTVTAADAQRAATIANAAAKALNTTRQRRGVQRANSAIEGVVRDLRKLDRGPGDATERSQLSDKLQRLRTLRAAQGSNAQVIEPAVAPAAPISPNPKRNAILAFVLAVLLGVGLVILVDRMDRRLRDADEVEKLVGVPLLAVISNDAFPGGRPTKRSALAFQTLRDSLTYFNVDEALTVIAVTSPLKGEGKTTVATNLAVSLARANKKVILVDADLRRPQVGKRMGVSDDAGLSSVLLGADLEDTLQEVAPFGSQLRILPSGPKPPNPSELIGSKRMSGLLKELTEIADVVVIDTTPLLVVSDAFPLLEQVSGTVGIARLDQTPREAVQRMVEITRTAGGRIFGMVATGAKGGNLRNYDYGYGYESEMPVVGVNPAPATNGGAPGEGGGAATSGLSPEPKESRSGKRRRRGRRAAANDTAETASQAQSSVERPADSEAETEVEPAESGSER
jgi:capsular exopolysaccharide synthesis family protein